MAYASMVWMPLGHVDNLGRPAEQEGGGGGGGSGLPWRITLLRGPVPLPVHDSPVLSLSFVPLCRNPRAVSADRDDRGPIHSVSVLACM